MDYELTERDAPFRARLPPHKSVADLIAKIIRSHNLHLTTMSASTSRVPTVTSLTSCRREACKIIVELLALAHDRGCERELAEELARTLDAGDLPDLAALRKLFAPDPARLPTVHVQLASLNGYEALIGTAYAGEAA